MFVVDLGRKKVLLEPFEFVFGNLDLHAVFGVKYYVHFRDTTTKR